MSLMCLALFARPGSSSGAKLEFSGTLGGIRAEEISSGVRVILHELREYCCSATYSCAVVLCIQCIVVLHIDLLAEPNHLVAEPWGVSLDASEAM